MLKDNTQAVTSIMNLTFFWKNNIINKDNEWIHLKNPEYIYDLNPIIASILKELQDNNDDELLQLLLASSFYSLYNIKKSWNSNQFYRDMEKLWLYIWKRSRRITIYSLIHNYSIKDYNVIQDLYIQNMQDLSLTILSYYNESEERLLKVFKKYIRHSNAWEMFQRWERGEFFCQRYNKYTLI